MRVGAIGSGGGMVMHGPAMNPSASASEQAPAYPSPAAELRTGTRRLAVLLGALAFFAVALTARGPGLTWDEAIYFGRAAHYLDWFRELSPESFGAEAIAWTWSARDHPPLGCLWIAGAFALFGPYGGMITAARLGAAVLFGLTVATVFLWSAARRGERNGLLAAGLFLLMPRVFAHAHFANLEMLTLLLWLLTVAAFERGIDSRPWSVLCGVFFGLALLTKINGAFLPVVLVPWGLLFHGRKALRNLLCMALIGPALFFLGWPLLWHFPVSGVKTYLFDKTRRMLIPVCYLGTTYRERFAPWHYPLVMLLATTPLPILAGAAAGIVAALRRLRSRWRGAAGDALLLWAFAFPVLLLALPGVPKYDGIRLMLPAMPFLAILAAEGLLRAWRVGRGPPAPGGTPGHRRALAAAAAALLGLWLLLPLFLLHPYQLAYYGELAGGPAGARRLGLETTYWGDTFDRKALRFLNENVPPDGAVALVGVGEFVWESYVLLGEARGDIRRVDFAAGAWDCLVVIPRQGLWDEQVRAWVASREPVWSTRLPGPGRVPVCLIYRR
jgi:4-amino-4-deoxy-L-arabinose transferase-like glycosyltransferase